MQYSNPTSKNGLAEEILRICGTTNNVYTNYAMITRVNDALDKYWFLASESAPRGSFDDTNNASLPVETQNLVSGTNAYKLTDFTNEVLQILKLSILDADAKEMDMSREEFFNLDDFQELYSTDTGDQGTPQWWTKMGDYIYVRPCPSYSEANGLRAYVNRELSKFAWTSFTTTFASDLFSAVGHGLSAGDAVIFETDNGDLPGGLTEDKTVYYVIASGLTDDAFKVSTTIGGSTITLTDDGTGNHKFTKVNKEPGIPVIHHKYLARVAALDFLIEKKLPQMNAISQLIQQDEQNIQEYWAHRGVELKTILRPSTRSYK